MIQKDNYLRVILDIIPSPAFIADHDFKIFDLNQAAKVFVGHDAAIRLSRLCGYVLHCLYAQDIAGGCGNTEYCPDCAIRNSVKAACDGNKTIRKKFELKSKKDDSIQSIHLLVSATPFECEDNKYALLILEDVTELTALRRLLPICICAKCKKIRNDSNYWESVSDYLSKYTNLKFTHSLCPECAKELYSNIDF